jgi:uncharacterized protein YyaL (SSP411 family)
MTTQTLNSLSKASSAYLRSAMHQPIQWYEWGEEAFAAARRVNKPMLLDIGAVWCHWCHVMDRESYDDPEVAHIVNENFIAVKVDRDERPDIDSRYQVAVSSISGQGGWPLTAFLTPDGKPFYGGTYFPPDDHWGRPGFKRVLLAIAGAFREKQDEVAEQARLVESAISRAEAFAGKNGDFEPAIIDAIVKSALDMFDESNGGFGNAPKFPHPAVLDLLIDQYSRSGDARIRKAFETTLEKMARGGVYDQLAGGFHRYSVDERWVVPHFEKMSYDNSELLKNYVHAYQASGSEFFADIARDIIRWMDEWLSDRDQGGFYASQDADYSMDDDGDYFTWTLDEARAVLTDDELKVASPYYDINEVGEMHHNPAKNVLYIRASIDEVASRTSFAPEKVRQLLQSAKNKLYTARLRRPTPYVDKTVYVNWNALAISAYLQAAQILSLAEAKRFALRSLDRVLSGAWSPQRGLAHVVAYSSRDVEQREVIGLLDDYANLTIACLDAYETTADITYFGFAKQIADVMLDKFFDPASGGFFDTPANEKESLGVLGTRRKPFQDSPTPAGNSNAAIALLRLHALSNDSRYREAAQRTVELFAGIAGQYGIFAGTYGIAAVIFAKPHLHVVVVGNGPLADELSGTARKEFALNKSVIVLPENGAVRQNLPPALAETIPNLPSVQQWQTVAVVCSNFTCQPPIASAKGLAETLRLSTTTTR